MVTEVLWGVLLPFFGTSLGAACVFFLHKLPGDGLQRVLLGFAAVLQPRCPSSAFRLW